MWLATTGRRNSGVQGYVALTRVVPGVQPGYGTKTLDGSRTLEQVTVTPRLVGSSTLPLGAMVCYTSGTATAGKKVWNTS